jgi:hypothetical protein
VTELNGKANSLETEDKPLPVYLKTTATVLTPDIGGAERSARAQNVSVKLEAVRLTASS